MVRCQNPANAGPFGGCVPVQMVSSSLESGGITSNPNRLATQRQQLPRLQAPPPMPEAQLPRRGISRYAQLRKGRRPRRARKVARRPEELPPPEGPALLVPMLVLLILALPVQRTDAARRLRTLRIAPSFAGLRVFDLCPFRLGL